MARPLGAHPEVEIGDKRRRVVVEHYDKVIATSTLGIQKFVVS